MVVRLYSSGPPETSWQCILCLVAYSGLIRNDVKVRSKLILVVLAFVYLLEKFHLTPSLGDQMESEIFPMRIQIPWTHAS